jgi:transcriptional regulator with XRE-family HTH domain
MDYEFCDNIKRRRKERNLTQDEVGRLAEINGRNGSRYENGHLSPSRRTVEKFAKAFGIREISILPENDRSAVKRILAIVVKQNRLQQMMAS